MSSFKRKAGARAELPVGTRPSPSSPSTLLTSTGIPSLDDILGGGLPISCSLLILAPDPHSAYGQLVQNYSIAQGLVAGQTVCVVDESPDSIFDDCMWIPPNGPIAEDKQEQDAAQQDEKIKIAWRYETMKQFQTTVDAISNQDEFCRTFDLTCRIPRPVVDKALESKQIVAIDLASVVDGPMIFQSVIGRITEACQESCSASKPLRICIPSLGSPSWGEFGPQLKDILYFLHALRGLLRQHPNVCATICLCPHLATDSWGGLGWTKKLGWAVDACITLEAFTANPSLIAMFPSHHGLVRVHALPAPHTILAPSDKFSTLRGVASSASAGGGENNLAFKCMRKRMLFETLHLDLEGGVGERRTTPATNTSTIERNNLKESDPRSKGEAVIRVAVEEERSAGILKKPKTGKRVGFTSERPDLYDF